MGKRIGILFFLSIYLIPSWQMPNMAFPELSGFAKTLWLSVPIIVFSFSHAAAISSFANVQRGHYGNDAAAKSEAILKRTSLLLIVFVLLFVFSCVLSLSTEQMAQAKAHLSVLLLACKHPPAGTSSARLNCVLATCRKN